MMDQRRVRLCDQREREELERHIRESDAASTRKMTDQRLSTKEEGMFEPDFPIECTMNPVSYQLLRIHDVSSIENKLGSLHVIKDNLVVKCFELAPFGKLDADSLVCVTHNTYLLNQGEACWLKMNGWSQSNFFMFKSFWF